MILKPLIHIDPYFVDIQLLLNSENLKSRAQTRVKHELQIDRSKRVKLVEVEDIEKKSYLVLEFAVTKNNQSAE